MQGLIHFYCKHVHKTIEIKYSQFNQNMKENLTKIDSIRY